MRSGIQVWRVIYFVKLKYTSSNIQMILLTHWGRVAHICVSELTIIGSDNDLSPGRRQAIIWTNAGILLIGPLGTNFNEILSEIHTFSFKKMHLNMSSGKWRPICLGLNVLRVASYLKNYFRKPLFKPMIWYFYCQLEQMDYISVEFWNSKLIIEEMHFILSSANIFRPQDVK